VATTADIRDGLADRLETISGLRVYRYYPGQINTPAAVVSRRQTRYDQTIDGAEDYTFAVTLFVQKGEDVTAQKALDLYLDPAGTSSVVAAIHGDPTLGGVVDFSRVVSAERDGLVEYAGVEYVSCELLVEVGE
jgi:hypothetical protein